MQEALVAYGLPGIVIAALLAAVTKLYGSLEAVQEKRIAESRESIKALEQNTNALETLTELIRERRNG